MLLEAYHAVRFVELLINDIISNQCVEDEILGSKTDSVVVSKAI